MTCDEIRERMLDVAAGLSEAAAEEKNHLAGCDACAGKLEEIRQSMAWLDEWRAPELSPYFDVRLQARLRAEMAKPEAGCRQWFRRPGLAGPPTLALARGLAS